MKKNLLLLFSIIFLGNCFCQEALDTDISIYRDINQSFENQYYPGTVEKTDLLQKIYPDSVFIQGALIYKSTALYNLKCYDEAISTLKDAINHMHTGKRGFAYCHFLLGKSYFSLGEYNQALKYFFQGCKLASLNNRISEDNKKVYNQGIFYSAECCFILGDYEKSESLFEYVIEHGKCFSPEDYILAVKKLIVSYNKCENYRKTIDLYNIMDFSNFPVNEKNIIKLYIGEAYESLGQSDQAYKIYSKIEDESSGYNKDIIDDFWIHLGVNAYKNNNYIKAQEYFSKINNDNSIVKIYQVKMLLNSDFSVQAGEKAEKILLNIKNLNEKKYKKVENLQDTYFSLLLQSYVQQEKWENIPKTFKNITNPQEKDFYIYYAYYYRKGDFSKITPEAGILYPSAMAKLGKYQLAEEGFKELDKKGKLENKYLLEYGKVLFCLEKYNQAYNVSLKSSENEKDYICGLCKINMGDFSGGKKHFISYIKNAINTKDFNILALYYMGYVDFFLGEYKNAYNSFSEFITQAGENKSEYTKDALKKMEKL